MRDEETGTLRAVVWSEVIPWLNLFRCLSVALSPRLLALSAVAMLLTLAGWWAGEWGLGELASPPGVSVQIAGHAATLTTSRPERTWCPWLAVAELVPQEPSLLLWEAFAPAEPALATLHRRSAEPVIGTWEQLSRPLRQLFGLPRPTGWRVLFLLCCGIWAMAVWAFFGGAMTRYAAVRLATQEQLSLRAMFRYAAMRWRHYFFAPLGVLLVVVLLALMIGAFGLLLRDDWGTCVAGLAWPVVLLFGAGMALLAVGLLFGWPLMWASISTDGNDGFGAIGNAFSYVFQRPLHYLFYALVAAILGTAGWLLLSNMVAAVLSLTYWAAGIGCGSQRLATVIAGTDGLSAWGQAGAVFIHFWGDLLRCLTAGFLGSFFWTASTAIYCLLRRHVDGAELDELHREEEEQEQGMGLPPLPTETSSAAAATPEPTPGSDRPGTP